MHIKPNLGEEIGRGKSGFAVNRGFTKFIFTAHCSVLIRARALVAILFCLAV